jgi:hypothetical protein
MAPKPIGVDYLNPEAGLGAERRQLYLCSRDLLCLRGGERETNFFRYQSLCIFKAFWNIATCVGALWGCVDGQ